MASGGFYFGGIFRGVFILLHKINCVITYKYIESLMDAAPIRKPKLKGLFLFGFGFFLSQFVPGSMDRLEITK